VTTLDLAARLVLALVFLVSGFAKLADREGSRRAVVDFGVRPGLVPVVAASLVPLELAGAAGLLSRGLGVVIGATLAAVMLTAFTVAIVASLAHGRTVDCHCFGAASAQPVSWWSVVRNLVLLALAGLVLAGGTGQPWPWQALAHVADGLDAQARWLWVAILALGSAVAVLASLFWSLLRRYGQVLARLDALEDATTAGHGHAHEVAFESFPLPGLAVSDATGVAIDVAALMAPEGFTLLVFVSPHCAACEELAEEVKAWQRADTDLPMVVFSPGSRAEIAAKFGDLVVHQLPDDVAAEAFGMEYTPGAVVAENGSIVSPASFGADEMRSLYAALTGRMGPVDVPFGRGVAGPGDALPEVTLTTGSGPTSVVDAAVGAGDDAVVLLWDTTCGYCQQIQDDVARLTQDTPTLVVLRDRDLPALRTAGVVGPVALDPAFALGDALGAPGTPSAVRVRDGVIASTLAVGGPEVLDLLAGARVAGRV